MQNHRKYRFLGWNGAVSKCVLFFHCYLESVWPPCLHYYILGLEQVLWCHIYLLTPFEKYQQKKWVLTWNYKKQKENKLILSKMSLFVFRYFGSVSDISSSYTYRTTIFWIKCGIYNSTYHLLVLWNYKCVVCHWLNVHVVPETWFI